jgi:hypothetical protein
MPVMEFHLDDIVTLKKKHPCGGFDWIVCRLGADIGIVCRTCGHKVLIPRTNLEDRLKKVKRAKSSSPITC